MAEGKGDFHHLVLAKEIKDDQIHDLIKGYANLVNLIPSMKAFHWSRDLSTGNLNDGFTHVFDGRFESTQGIAEYVHHPAHIEFADLMAPALEKVIVVDFKPHVLL